ncbi:MAG: ATP-binding protein [Nanoarchaeota archaeon]
MEKDKIIQILQGQNFWGKDQQLGFIRKSYLKTFRSRSQLKEALVLVGVRRCGKSTLSKQFMAELIQKGVKKEETLYINLEEPPFSSYLNLELLDMIYSAYREIISDQTKIIVLDEIQNIPAWEKWVRSKLENDPTIKIIVTGSSSKLLSSEFSTVLSGRSIPFEIYPFSFREFAGLNGLKIENEKEIYLNKEKLKLLLRKYLEFGGFPRVVLEAKENKNLLLKEYYESILLRDVAARYQIKEINVLKALSTLILTQNGSLVSIAKLTTAIQEAFKLKVSLETISRFMSYLESAYLIFFAPIFSYKIKEQMKYPRKVYCIDTGLRNAVSFRFSEDLGKLAETVVFLKLRKEDKEIFYWKSDKNKEVDFVVRKGMKIHRLINVCWNLSNAETRKRETESLIEAMIEFKMKEAILITDDEEREEKKTGRTIKFIPLWKWLLT